MTLHLCCCSPWISRLPHHYYPKNFTTPLHNYCFLFTNRRTFSGCRISKNFIKFSGKNEVSSSSEKQLVSEIGDRETLSAIAAVEDSNGVLKVITEKTKKNGGVLSCSDCRLIISAALDRGNVDLALSVFSAMRSSFRPTVSDKVIPVERWTWSRPDVHTYTLLVKGLAASLRVLDALQMIDSVCRVGVSPGEEVPFGKVVRCPSCMIAIAVSQPQHGIQIVSCSKCRYTYELVSGNILSTESEEISLYVSNCSSIRSQHTPPE